MTEPSAADPAVTDDAVAIAAAQAAIDTPGVTRVVPAIGYLIRDAVSGLARQLTGPQPAPETRADPDAVEVERVDGALRLTIRIVATGTPPVLATIGAVRTAVEQALAAAFGLTAQVSVLVVDTAWEPDASPSAR